ncbi:DUF1028 domain-containing protein [Vibrio sp.]|nr:DUF1028 domain-containing protein [Vibrio sp.]
MTISLIHFNPQTGLSASITATGGVSVGGYVNHSWRAIGGCATQGLFTNPWYAEKSKALLQQGLNAEDVIACLKKGDVGYQRRQCMVMDKQGRSAFIHGNENIPYTGSVDYPHVAVAGNMLPNEAVLTSFINTFINEISVNAEAVLQSGAVPEYKDNYEASLPEILINALDACLNSGGDKRGTFSASLRVESATKAPIDIRVDWSDDSLIDDIRKVLSQVRSASFQSFLNELPNG